MGECYSTNKQQIYLLGQIQTGKTGGQPYSCTSPCVSYIALSYETVKVFSNFNIVLVNGSEFCEAGMLTEISPA